jgi:hypothetical protein
MNYFKNKLKNHWPITPKGDACGFVEFCQVFFKKIKIKICFFEIHAKKTHKKSNIFWLSWCFKKKTLGLIKRSYFEDFKVTWETNLQIGFF